jgi:hypothetical protein
MKIFKGFEYSMKSMSNRFKLKFFSPWMIISAFLVLVFANQVRAQETHNSLRAHPAVLSKIALAADPLDPKTICFRANTPKLTSDIQLTINPNRYIFGETTATIHDKATSYYSSYSQKFEGDLKGNRLKLNIITQIEQDTQNSQEFWQSNKDNLIVNGTPHSTVKCSEEALPPIPVRILRLKFKPGTQSTTLENAVVRGTRDIYLLKAKAGQRMRLQITSLEKNAVFDLLAPGGEVIRQEATQADLRLPSAGEFQVVVGGTRGNAGYRLNVKID